MPNTYKKIASVTVGSGGAASINFTSIPQTYTDLKIVVSARGTAGFASSGNYYVIKPNGLNTNLSGKYLIGIGTSVATGSFQPFGYMSPSDYTASVFGNGEHYISNYTSANYKSFSSNDTAESNDSIMYAVDIGAGLWSSTDAITSLTLTPGGGNFAQYTTATLYGIGDVTASKFAKAVGGVITYDANYVYHTYPYSGNFTPNTALTVDYLVVAGAGGGGGPGVSGGGGGGAGGARCTVGQTGGGGSLESPLSLSSGSAYTVTIGAGGATDTIGNNSVFASITSTAGGRGKSSGSAANANGGSGGGGNGTAAGVSANIAGTGTANQGYAGGDGFPGPGDNARNSGGGGGAGSVGAAGTASVGGNGGSGITTSISGTSTVYAGGGGGGVGYGTRGTGTNGGGNGGNGSTAGVAGTTNTGSGGGGGGRNESTGTTQVAGAGGSGIVIIRYPR